ncbi:MAG: PH domain-containing protein [Myxococcota bacterium]|nr:PH domain-containing protein [Myxococcota bacterium]
MTELSPKRSSFMFTRLVGGVSLASILALVLGITAVVAEELLLVIPGVLLWFVLVVLTLVSGMVAWKKEKYEIHPHHLVMHRGGLASDQTTELDVKNITHVKQRLSWIRYRFFDVGDVIVQSAGSASAEVVFRSIQNPDAVYAQIRELMKTNSFSMKGETLLHQESPSTLGAVVEVASIAAGGVLAVGWLGAGVLGAMSSAGPAGMALEGLLVVGLVLLVCIFLVLHFFDMRRRTYTVYDDLVEYQEGFLSRTNAVIPYENIADASTRQTAFDRVLGLYNVRVSCQGSSSEIGFRRLASGPKLQSVIRGRVDAAQASREQREQLRVVPPKAEGSGVKSTRPAAQSIPSAEAWTAELQMNTARAFCSAAILRALGTTYSVGPSSVSSQFTLIGNQQLEFAYDKVTGIQVRTSPWDALFGTFTIRIWSIGSSMPLDLAHVPRAAVDLPALLRQSGIPGGEARCSFPASFGLLVWLRAHVVGAVMVPMLVLLSLVLAAAVSWEMLLPILSLLGFIVVSLPILTVRYRQQRLTFHTHHMEHVAGILWKKHTYARYDDIKKISVRRYVGTRRGRLQVFVAGEVQTQGSKGQSVVLPNTFIAHYLEEVTPLTETIDDLLLGRIEPEAVMQPRESTPAGAEFRPAVSNSLVALLLGGIFCPPIWLLAPYVVLRVKRKVYRVASDRAVVEEGVLYRTHTSVLFDRIDSIQQGQGALGKMFSNGSVTLMTAGSSRPDLFLKNTPDYQSLYRMIRERDGE